MVRLLDQMPDSSGPTIRTLQLAFASSRQFHLDQPYLRCLAKVLSKSMFSALKTIHIVAFSQTVDSSLDITVMSSVTEALDYWHQRDALRFTFVR